MFRVTAVRLAESVSKQPLNLREASAALLPPLPYVSITFGAERADSIYCVNSLYRRILRAHRYLPYEMRSLGDDYVRAGEWSLITS